MFLGAGCGHLRILGNGCGRRKRFTTAHCGFERSKHNGRLFVRSAKWRVLHLFFGSWLAAAALQWKSQNRRKCDGKGSNLQHLKDNWPAAALLGKSIVKCWMSQKFPPASSDEVFTTGFQDFKIVSRVCYFQEGGKSKLKMRKDHIFRASYCKQHLALAMTWKRKSGKWKPLWKAEGGEVFCFSLPQCSTPQSNHQQLQQKKKKQTI